MLGSRSRSIWSADGEDAFAQQAQGGGAARLFAALSSLDAPAKGAAGAQSPETAPQAPGGEQPQFTGPGDTIGDNTSSTTTIAVGASLTSSINAGFPTPDLDYIKVSLVAGQTYVFSMGNGTMDDDYIELRNSSNTLVAENDDGGIVRDAFLKYTATTTGDYWIVARGYDGSNTGSYTLSVNTLITGNTSPTTFIDNGKPKFSWDEAAIQITRTGAAWSDAFGSPTVVTYAYRSTAPGAMPDDTSGFSRFSLAQISATEAALAGWASVANIVFQRVDGGDGYSNNATMLFANYSSGVSGASAFAYLPSEGVRSSSSVQGDVWVNISLANNQDLSAGGFGRQILLHEIGHAIGLRHPGDYNAGEGADPTYEANAEYFGDSRAFTVMSYFGSPPVGANLPAFASIPQLHDIAAAQRLYGANTGTRTGDTIYGFNSNTGIAEYTLTSSIQAVVFSIWDGGGIDTIDMSGYAVAQTIDLRQEAMSSVGGSIFNVSIARGVVIENAIGGPLQDTIIGNDAANVLRGNGGADAIAGNGGDDVLIGGVGADALNGGDGLDIASYEDAPNGITVNLAAPGANTGIAAGDTYIAVEGVRGSDFNDVLAGNTGANALDGGAGNDYIDGGAGADVMRGGLGNDTFVFDDAGDVAIEQSGEGVDTVYSYVSVNALGTNIENLVLLGAAVNAFGNAGANGILGNDQNNIIAGFGGADALDGGAGNDYIDGGAGADVMRGGLGNDTFVFDDAGDVAIEQSGEGVDTVYSYVSVNALGTNIENLVLLGAAINAFGNAGANGILGNDQNNIIAGFGGADALDGGAGNDYIDGGAGADVMRGGLGNDTFVFDDAGDVAIEQSGEGVDTVYSYVSVNALGTNIENLVLLGAAVNAFGNAGANGILGNDQNNIIAGFGGADALDGGAGNDYIDGGAGADVMRGGLGNDTFVFDDAGDVAIEQSGEGVDTVYSYVSVNALGTNIENLVLLGAAVNATGNELNNSILGTAGDNVLDGAGGNDSLEGGLGADTLTGGAGDDTFVFRAGQLANGVQDTITDFEALGAGENDTIRFFGISASAVTTSDVSGGVLITIDLDGGESATIFVANQTAESIADDFIFG